MEAVYNQKEDLPDDSLNPTYEFGTELATDALSINKF